MIHLFLSPHFDDAIYSCGGTICELSQAGHEVIILTLMAGEPTFPIPDTPVLNDNHTRWQVGDNPIIARKQEDKASAKIVDAQTQYANLVDCIYRVHNGEALYATEESLWKNVHPQDPALDGLNTLKLPEFDRLYAPLGVGEHVDHLIVRDWAWNLAQKRQFPVNFYVEYPYLRQKIAVEKAYNAFPVALTTIECPFSKEALQKKIKAMMAYQSQIKSFWEDENAIAEEVQQTFTKNGQFIEEFAEPNYP